MSAAADAGSVVAKNDDIPPGRTGMGPSFFPLSSSSRYRMFVYVCMHVWLVV